MDNFFFTLLLHDSLKKVHIGGSLDIKSETICEIINSNRSIEELKIDINLNNVNYFNLSKLEEALMDNYVITKLDIGDTIKGLKITSDVIERELRYNLQLKCQQK
jgi:DNA-binding transcriptional regulator LsrR (DeoR family)